MPAGYSVGGQFCTLSWRADEKGLGGGRRTIGNKTKANAPEGLILKLPAVEEMVVYPSRAA